MTGSSNLITHSTSGASASVEISSAQGGENALRCQFGRGLCVVCCVSGSGLLLWSNISVEGSFDSVWALPFLLINMSLLVCVGLRGIAI